MLSPGSCAHIPSSIKLLFQEYDFDGSGYIHKDDLVSVMVCLGMPISRASELLSFFKFSERLPENGGSIEYIAFIDWLLDLGREVSSVASSADEVKLIARSSNASVPLQGGLANLHRVKHVLMGGRHGVEKLFASLEEFFCCVNQEHEVQNKMRRALRIFEDIAFLSPGSEPAELIALTHECSLAWESFAKWCVEELMSEAFAFFDFAGKGKLLAQELMTFLMLLAVNHSADVDITLNPADAETIVQEFDVAGDGMLSKEEFLTMVHALEEESGLWTKNMVLPQPQLQLFFDVNNTVMVADTLTGAGAKDLIAMTLSGCAWGMRARQQGKDVWILVCQEPSALPPWEGLLSYTEFIVEVCPMPSGKTKTKEEVENVKNWRRKALQNFCEPEHPGEALRPHLDKLVAAVSPQFKLLPSFYSLLLRLVRSRRSFSLAFRTFGVDIDNSVEREFNDFCNGRHPLFPGGPLLNGSDGGPDLRMDLSDAASIGTFVRTDDDSMALVWGTHTQPPAGKGLEFYEDMPRVKVIRGTAEAANSLQERLKSTTRVTVLRDFYPGWSKAKFSGKGGKPLFLNVEDDALLPIFFDDHIRPVDPTIVDVIDVRRLPQRVPMAQVYYSHMVKAVPLRSISEPNYFWDEVRRCELQKQAQLLRRRTVGRVLHDIPAIRKVITLLSGESHLEDWIEPPPTASSESVPLSRRKSLTREFSKEASEAMKYTPWDKQEAVKHAAPFVGIQ